MVWSSDVKDDDRNKNGDLKCSGKASRNKQEHARIFRNAIEHLGVGIVFRKESPKYICDIRQQAQ